MEKGEVLSKVRKLLYVKYALGIIMVIHYAVLEWLIGFMDELNLSDRFIENCEFSAKIGLFVYFGKEVIDLYQKFHAGGNNNNRR